MKCRNSKKSGDKEWTSAANIGRHCNTESNSNGLAHHTLGLSLGYDLYETKLSPHYSQVTYKHSILTMPKDIQANITWETNSLRISLTSAKFRLAAMPALKQLLVAACANQLVIRTASKMSQ
jgi:hypothetical protein